jgi:hemolysin activation/secretion protein
MQLIGRNHAIFLLWFASLPTLAQELPPPPLTPEERDFLSGKATIFVRDLEFRNYTVFTREQLLAAPVVTREENGKTIVDKRVSDSLGRAVTLDDLEAIRLGISQFYVSNGYINSGAVIPEQNGSDGIIRIDIVEGKLTQINLNTNGRLKPDYFRKRIEWNLKSPLNINQLHDRLEIVRQNPNIERINAGLRPGISPGESMLDVAVYQANPWQVALSLNNYRSPSVGAERFVLNASSLNLLGFGDSASLRYGLTTGGLSDIELDSPADPKDFSICYSIPLSPSDTTLSFAVDKTDDTVIDSTFDELDIQSEGMTYAITLRQPVYRTPRSEVALFLTGTMRSSKTFLMGEPYAFPPDPASETNITAIRFGQEYSTRRTREALSLRSTFTFGLNAFGATRSDGADGQFVAWLGQGQYLRKLGDSDIQLACRVSAQVASDSLLSMEQFAVGGVYTVRGYRENQVVRDNAVTSSIELHIPLIQKNGESILDLVPFVDAGYAVNHNGSPESECISSVGMGVLFNPSTHVHIEVYWGYPFKTFDEGDDDLQDMGFHFDVTVSAF